GRHAGSADMSAPSRRHRHLRRGVKLGSASAVPPPDERHTSCPSTAAMLRITVTTRHDQTTLALEGRLTGPWVDELARCWEGLPARDLRATDVQLDGVTFIDPAGKALLRRMHDQGATLSSCGCMTRAILEEIA